MEAAGRVENLNREAVLVEADPAHPDSLAGDYADRHEAIRDLGIRVVQRFTKTGRAAPAADIREVGPVGMTMHADRVAVRASALAVEQSLSFGDVTFDSG